MKVLITGGAGFIGSHVAEEFQDRAEVRVLDNLRTGRRENLAGLRHEFLEASIEDRERVREAMQGVECVFHLAAFVSVPESMAAPAECTSINALGTLTVLEEAARAGVRKLCFASSAAVYGDNPESPKIETMPPCPRSPYAMSKLDGEFYCQLFQEQGRLETVVFRYFNVFGPRQDPSSPYAAAVPLFVARALRNEPITIFGDGGQTRDFVYVKDVAAANRYAAETPGLHGLFNVASGHTQSVNDLATEVRRVTGSSGDIQHGPERAGDIRHSAASTARLTEAGFRPVWSFSRGLAATVEHARTRGATPTREGPC